MSIEAIFEEASNRFIEETPQGERTFSGFFSWYIRNYVNDFKRQKEAVKLIAHGEEQLLLAMLESKKPFDIHFPKYLLDVEWGDGLQIIDREKFCEMLIDNEPFLPELFAEHKKKGVKPIVAVLPGMGERGLNYLLLNRVDPSKPVAVKPYQSGEEKDIATMFNGTLGPKVYSAGKSSIAEEVLASVKPFDDSNKPPNGEWLGIEVFLQDPVTAGSAAAYLFAAMHKNKVIYWAWNWAEEVRTEIKDGVAQLPRILDFGASYVWEEGKDPPYMDQPKDWNGAVKTDMDKVRKAFENMYQGDCSKHGKDALSVAVRTFEQKYHARMEAKQS